MSAASLHEGRHAASALLNSLTVKAARLGPNGSGAITVEPWDPERGHDHTRAYLKMLMSGYLTERVEWPPTYPRETSVDKDERDALKVFRASGLVPVEWDRIRAETLQQTSDPEFTRVARTIANELERRGELTESHLLAIAGRTKEVTHMEHITFKTVVSQTTDQGLFEAVIATRSADREKDIVEPSAIVNALGMWTSNDKTISLRWNHGKTPEYVIGSVNPHSAKAVDGEVVVTGQLDFDSPHGQEAWRLIKSGVVGFSYGYMTTDSQDLPDGGRHIRGMDIYEVTLTTTPMNNETRVLSTKSVDDQGIDPRIVAEIKGFDEVYERADAKHAATQRKHVEPIVVRTFAA